MRARAVGLLLGALADAVFADPRRWHPVAGFGACAAALERRWYADRRVAGAAHTAVLVGAAVGLGVAAEAVSRRHPIAQVGVTALATWTVLGGTSLAVHGEALAAALNGESGVPARRVRVLGTPPQGESGVSARRVGDFDTPPQGESGVSTRRVGGFDTPGEPDLLSARALIPSLCGRDPAALDAAGMARAGTESMAENASDAAVAPLLWGAVAGVPGLLGYRAVNTLDAMVGYRSPRHLRFGWAAARLDDLVNLVPSRLAALLFAALAPAVGGSPRAALAAWRRDAAAHPSPNAGPVEAAAAGALGVALGGPTVYPHGTENRPRLGVGPPPTADDLRRSARLARLVAAAAAVLASVVAAAATPCDESPVRRSGADESPARRSRLGWWLVVARQVSAERGSLVSASCS